MDTINLPTVFLLPLTKNADSPGKQSASARRNLRLSILQYVYKPKLYVAHLTT